MKTNKICKQVVFIWNAEWNNNVIKSQFITQTIAFDCKDNNFNCLKINCSKNCSAAKLQHMSSRFEKKVKTAKRFCQYIDQLLENEMVNMCAAYFFLLSSWYFSVERLILLKKVSSSCDSSRWMDFCPPPFQLKKDNK